MSDQPGYQLSDADRELANRLNAAEGVVWRGKAQYVAEHLAKAKDISLTSVYKICAEALKLGESTARMYVRLETAFGQVLDECRTPDGDEKVSVFQLRQIWSEARRLKIAPDEALIRRINESDKWGGQVAPPDVIRAQNRDGASKEPDPLRRALKAARGPLATAARKSNKADAMVLESWVKWIDGRLENGK